MQRIFAFTTLAVVVRHWYEVGETDEEHGVRVELRGVADVAHRGTASAAQPIELDRILWRVDIFDRVGGPPGNLERAHYHNKFDGIEPIGRQWDDDLAADPFAWLERYLDAVDDLVGDSTAAVADDVREIRRARPDILATARACAADTCSDVAECLRRTRDTGHVVELMSREVRPEHPGDPRLAFAADSP